MAGGVPEPRRGPGANQSHVGAAQLALVLRAQEERARYDGGSRGRNGSSEELYRVGPVVAGAAAPDLGISHDRAK